jgi:hypothetical protein
VPSKHFVIGGDDKTKRKAGEDGSGDDFFYKNKHLFDRISVGQFLLLTFVYSKSIIDSEIL